MLQCLREFCLHKTDVPLGEVRLVSLFQKVPFDSVLVYNLASEGRTGCHRVAIGVDDSHVSRELNKFCHGIQPLVGSLSFCGKHKESVGKVFDGNEEACRSRVVPRPVFVKFAVVDVVHAGFWNSYSLKLSDPVGATVMTYGRMRREKVGYVVELHKIVENFFFPGKRDELSPRQDNPFFGERFFKVVFDQVQTSLLRQSRRRRRRRRRRHRRSRHRRLLECKRSERCDNRRR